MRHSNRLAAIDDSCNLATANQSPIFNELKPKRPMKKLFTGLLVLAAFVVDAQPKPDLITVNNVKPKNGQKMAFEAAYKAHIAKFHATSDKTNVFEIMSGRYEGYYLLIGPAETFADFDKPRADATAHNLDLDKNFFPLLEETMNGVYQSVDSLAIHPSVPAEAFVVTIRHMDEDLNMQDYRRELARASKIRSAQKAAFWVSFSTNYYEQLWDGTDQVTVVVRNLKDGFKSLANGFYPQEAPGSPSFRDEYAKLYGHNAWDEREKVLKGAINKSEQYIMRLRKDLSSK
jgi:hypothetical protein